MRSTAVALYNIMVGEFYLVRHYDPYQELAIFSLSPTIHLTKGETIFTQEQVDYYMELLANAKKADFVYGVEYSIFKENKAKIIKLGEQKQGEK